MSRRAGPPYPVLVPLGRVFRGVVCVAVLAAAGACSPATDQPGEGGTTITAPTATESPGSPGGSATTATPDGSPSSPSGTRSSRKSLDPQVSGVVAADLSVPWGIAFLPDGSALVAERDTALVKRVSARGRVSTVGEVPGVVPSSEGGLLGLAVSPTYDEDRLVYAYLSTAEDNRVVRMEYDGRDLGRPQVVLTGIPVGQIHNGGRLLFGPDGMLYVSTGEAGDEELAQDPGSLGGKILRLQPDGSVPADNPDPGSPVWTSGHRNVQGVAFDAAERLWATEFGSDVWDELNRIEPGENYGWPLAEGDADVEDFVDPRVQWRPENASPSGLAFAAGHLWAASLRGERLWLMRVLPDGSVGTPRPLLIGDYGRLRTVVAAPDGSLWVSTSNRDGRGDPAPNDDRILRLTLR
ncbi:MAG: PQQ-dependent sugar dehydrogenase [Actinomycetota bacterium]|nr:PQQ-dependent sugar dehydrogenase [Actinomycetota bacterium]